MGRKDICVPEIVQFQTEDASKVAELFNSFDKEGLWPGGFTGGVPYTAQRVLDTFPVGVKNICILISKCNDKFTGICTLHPHYEDEEAGYIGVLGVHPDYLGKGHGKALILKSLQIAIENDLRRVDLNTWAGNLRAVPLYKKCGMFWVPETSVSMQDYIPGIIGFPIVKEFFKKHDWYSSQVRKLELVPDEFRLENMEVFLYEFSQDEDHVKIWVDRHSRGILGIESTFNNEHLKIAAKLEDHKVIAGVEQDLTIEIQNDTKKTIQGSLSLSGFKGLNFTVQPQQSFEIGNGTSIDLNAKFTVSPEIEIPDESRKQKVIKADLRINDELIPFEIGMRVLPLLEIRTYPESIAVRPGTRGIIQFNAFNNSKTCFAGNLYVIDRLKKLFQKEIVIPIEILPREHSGFNMAIEVPSDDSTSLIPLELSAKGKVNGADVETRTELTYVKCFGPGGIVATSEDTKQGKSVFIENEDLIACVRLRDALLEITYKGALYGPQRIYNHGGFGVGPPFGFVRPIKYDYEVTRKPEGLELVLSGMHPDKSGLKMMRILTFFSGKSIIKERIKIVNMNRELTHKANVRISGRGFLESIYYTMIVPLEEIIEQEMIGFPVSESDLPTDPKSYSESWICFQNQAQDFCFGQIWSREKVSKIRIGGQSYLVPEYELGEIKPGQSACTSELYYLIERGNWQTIRRRWQSLIEKKVLPEGERRSVEAKPLLDIRLEDTILCRNAEHRTRLKVVNCRNKGTTGNIVLSPPRGWEITPSNIKVRNVSIKNPFATEISLVPPAQAKDGIHSGVIKFSSENQEICFPMDLCILSRLDKPSVTIVSSKEEGKTVYKISNGLLRFKASAEFAGCLYFLGQYDANQLATGFPDVGTKVFLENYFGGIRALYLDERFDFQKSKSHEESYTAKPIREGRWKGVEFSFQSEKQEELKGLRGSISYTTLPFSNVVKIRRKFHNPTLASFQFNNCLWVSPHVGRDFQENEAIFPRVDRTFRFKRGEGFAISGVQPERGWILVANQREKKGLGIIVGNIDRSMILSLDLGKTMLELFIMSRIQLRSGESCELEEYTVLNEGEYKNMDKLAKTLRHYQVRN